MDERNLWLDDSTKVMVMWCSLHMLDDQCEDWRVVSGRAEITRPFRSIEDDNDVEVKRQRLGEPLATIPETSDEMMEDPVPLVHKELKRERLTKKTSREPMEMSSGSGGPKRMRTSCLRVSSVNAVQKTLDKN